MYILKKLLASFIGLTISLSTFTAPIYADNQNDQFNDFMNEQFKDYMEQDYTTMHFGVKDYSKYGIKKPTVNIGTASWDNYAAQKEKYKSDLKQLHEFDYSSLNDTQKEDYKAVEFDLENKITLCNYPYFDFAFTSEMGILNNMMNVFNEFTFYNEEDINDYITCLFTVPDFLDQSMQITKKQADKGYFLNDKQLKDTDDYIDNFTSKTDDNALITIFNDKIDNVQGISDESKKIYKDKNKEAITKQVIPAFKKCKKELDRLKGSRKYGDRIYDLPDGDKYYAALAKTYSSVDGNVQEIQNICTDYLKEYIPEYKEAMSSKDHDEEININTPEEDLSYLQKTLQYFPQTEGMIYEQGKTYTVSYLSKEASNSKVMAYCLLPPIDDWQTNNVIKVNKENTSDRTTMYMTLSHEGFPGHLYQKTYYFSTNPFPIRAYLSMNGYQEGWGQYAQEYGINASSLNENAKKYQILNANISYVLLSAIDLGVNGLGWDLDDVKNYVSNLGMNSRIASSLYDSAITSPGIYLSYGVGYASFKRIKENAEKIAGDNFNDKEFNAVLLNNGDRTFNMVADDVAKWLHKDNVDLLKLDDKKADISKRNIDFNWILPLVIIIVGGSIIFVKREYK